MAESDNLSDVCRLVEVRVEDIRLAARIGAHVHELDRRQTLRVTVVLRLLAPPSDRLEDTVDYSFIIDRAEALADEHIALIETFGTRLAEACLAFERVEQADVLVEKPGALANGIASARIVMARSAPLRTTSRHRAALQCTAARGIADRDGGVDGSVSSEMTDIKITGIHKRQLA